MIIDYHFYALCEWFRTASKLRNRLVLAALFGIGWFGEAAAVTLEIEVSSRGGQVANSLDTTQCFDNCALSSSPGSAVSFFASPDKGYRFHGWSGACSGNKGPLCALKLAKDARLSARFIKVASPPQPSKAVLLLHDLAARQSVWNEFVNRHFDNRCPVVYGGVVLGEDSVNRANQVHCYRIAFGYYDLIGLASHVDEKVRLGFQPEGKAPMPDALANEIKAAVLGILNRHPNLSLALIGHGRSATAAESYLVSDSARNAGIMGLLALQAPAFQGEGKAVPGPTPLADPHGQPAIYDLDADPGQVGEIGSALLTMTDSWWHDRW
jgi:hypothetical protein